MTGDPRGLPPVVSPQPFALHSIHLPVTGINGIKQSQIGVVQTQLGADWKFARENAFTESKEVRTTLPFGAEREHRVPQWAALNMHDPVLTELYLRREKNPPGCPKWRVFGRCPFPFPDFLGRLGSDTPN